MTPAKLPNEVAPERIPITFYQRRPRPIGNYSLESIFIDVRTRLYDQIDATIRIAPCYSNGLIPRLRIMLDAWRQRDKTIHFTGDINFATSLCGSKRIVLTILDCGDLVKRRDWRRYLLKWYWYDLPVRKAEHITTISEASKRDIIALTGCAAEKISVIGVAISDRYVRVDKRFNQDCPRILQVGTAFNKNIERLADALSIINCQLVIVGKLSESQRVALDTSGVRYENLTNISEDEMIQQYNLCDIVAFVSIFEGFGMPIVEGQVVGRPVVTSNCSSMPEVAGEGACLVDPNNVESIREGIRRVIDDATYRESIVAHGFQNAKRFDPDEIAKQYLAIYRRIAHKRKPGDGRASDCDA